MKTKLLSVAAVVLLMAGMSAAGDDDNSKIRGCLMQMGDDFVLTDASGTKYEIDSMNATLKRHLGHVVEIAGEFEGRSRDEKHHAQKLEAKYVNHLADSCSVAAIHSAAMQGMGQNMQSMGTMPCPAPGQMQGGMGMHGHMGAAQPQGSAGVQTQETVGATSGAVQGGVLGTATGTTTGTGVSGSATASSPNITGNVGTTSGTETDIPPSGEKRVIRGCVQRSGEHYVLIEQGTSTSYRLDGEHDKLSTQLGNLVELKGDMERLNEASSSGAQLEFDVEEVTFLNSTCQ